MKSQWIAVFLIIHQTFAIGIPKFHLQNSKGLTVDHNKTDYDLSYDPRINQLKVEWYMKTMAFSTSRTLKISFSSPVRKFSLCLTDVKWNKHLWEQRQHDGKIMYVEGSLCEAADSKVVGSVFHGVFHGLIKAGNGLIEYYFFPCSGKFCKSSAHTKMYVEKIANLRHQSPETSRQIPDSLSQSFNWSSLPLHMRFGRAAATSRKRLYCPVSVLIHSSFVSGFASGFHAALYFMTQFAIVHQIFETEMAASPIPFGVSLNRISVLNTGEVVSDKNLMKSEDVIDSLRRHVMQHPSSFSSCSVGIMVEYNWEHVLGSGVFRKPMYSICDQNGLYTVSSVAENGRLTPTSFSLTNAHELGHNFGCPHDPDKKSGVDPRCPSDGGAQSATSALGGECIMSTTSNMGFLPNNYKFSGFSKSAMEGLLGSSDLSCLTDTITSLCGNFIKEEGEQCDAGPKGSTCCMSNCRLKPGTSCDFASDSCCTTACQLEPAGTRCNDETDCTQSSSCSGVSSGCPEAAQKANNSICDSGRAVCASGSCTGSVCVAGGKLDCTCTGKPCVLCCQDTASSSCIPLHDDQFRRSFGYPCDDGDGICNADGECIKITSDDGIFDFAWNFLFDSDLRIAFFSQIHWAFYFLFCLVILISYLGFLLLFEVNYERMYSKAVKNTINSIGL